MADKYPYQDNWEEYKSRLALPFLAIPAWIVFMVLAALTGAYFRSIAGSIGFNPLFIVPVVIIIFMLWAACFSALWRCPACKNYYRGSNAFEALTRRSRRDQHCRNCELPKVLWFYLSHGQVGSKKSR